MEEMQGTADRDAPQELCTLALALGRRDDCPGETCALWDRAAGACLLHGLELELGSSPAVAEHLLALRRALEGLAPGAALARPTEDEEESCESQT